MIAVWVFGGLLILGLGGWGIWKFLNYVNDKYDYNLFNWPNVLILAGTFAIVAVVYAFVRMIAEPTAEPNTELLNYLVCGGVVAISMLIVFIRNLRATSLGIAIVSLFLQVALMAVGVLVLLTGFFTGGRKE